jgi:chloride channel 3/4/5
VHFAATDAAGSTWFGIAVWLAFTSILAIIAVSCVYISPAVQGSGVPEMKCMLSGVRVKGFLNFKTFVAKTVCLTLAIASGKLAKYFYTESC